jgi:preprotein translocase subunit SecE
MSKLQKKKTVTEKKKRKEGAGAEGVAAAPAAKPASPAAPVKPRAAGGEGAAASANLFTRAAEFLREVKVELKKVTWPTRKQTTGRPLWLSSSSL